MTENYENYISRNIRAFYIRRLPAPMIYLVLLVVLWLVFPLENILKPAPLTMADSWDVAYESEIEHVSITMEKLTFTGYTSVRYGDTNGYWYYGQKGEECYLVLLAPYTCEEGLPDIPEVTVNAVLIEGNEVYDTLLEKLSADLEWTASGMASMMPGYYISEPDFHPILNALMFFVYFATGIYAIICIIRYLLFIVLPFTAPACQNLIVYGNPKALLDEAEEELLTLPQLATEDMFITEHYFIMTSPYGNAIVPIDQILWIYKYSTLQKFLWYHFSISYTLHISAKKHLFIQCPKNIKSDIDGIIDYLAEANHNIMVGFSEENRIKAQASQGKPFHIEKLFALLRKKV